MKISTHEMYDTVGHEHVGYNLKEICVVKCADGRYFVENNWDDKDFDNIVGISNPHILPYVEPSFFPSDVLARNFAVSAIKTVEPSFEYDESD